MPITNTPTQLPKHLPDDIEKCHALILALATDLDDYRSRVDYLARRLFGRRSEKMKVNPDQLLLFEQGESEIEVKPDEESETEPAPPRKKRKGHGRRKKLPENLPRVRVVIDVSDEEKNCSPCGREMKVIGEEVSEMLDYKPASLFVWQIVRPKYACADPECDSGVVIADMPARPIDKGLPGPGLLAHVITSKYCDHLPLYRQESILARHGVELSRKTLCDWVLRSAEILKPIVDAMKKEVVKSHVIHTDDTPIQTLIRGKKGHSHRAYLWPYVGDTDHPYNIYDFTWTRSGAGPKEILEDYKGHVQADAYPGYNALYESGDIVEVGCWMHVRRKFFDAKGSSPVYAHQAIEYIKDLYDIERDAKELSDEDRCAMRRERSRPLLDSIKTWLDELEPDVLPQSPLGKAIGYAVNNWDALSRYVDDGRLSIDNGAAERAIRPLVIGRKNYMFMGSARGGHAAAVLYSLVQSAKRHGVDPFAYIQDLLVRIDTHPHKQIEQLFPDNWKELPSEMI